MSVSAQPASGARARGAGATPSARTRVLHVVLNLEAGGLERLVVELATRADPARFESHVLALQYAGRHAAELRDVAAMHVAPAQSRGSMVRPTALARTIAAIAPQVVHTHSGVWYKATLAARMAGVPWLVHTDHGRLLPDPIGARLTDALAARRTDVVVAVSDALARYLRRALAVPARKVRVIENGVDTTALAPRADDGASRDARLALGIAAQVPIIGSVGRLDGIKGYDLLVDAFAALRAEWREGAAPALVIAGDGPAEGALRAQVAALDERVRRDVHLLGWRTDARALLPAFDLFAMASLSEGTSVSLLEAMSAGICPVVTDVGGNARVLGDALAHRLVPAGRPRALARAMAAALADDARRAADAVAARARVVATFGSTAMVERYEALYAEGTG